MGRGGGTVNSSPAAGSSSLLMTTRCGLIPLSSSAAGESGVALATTAAAAGLAIISLWVYYDATKSRQRTMLLIQEPTTASGSTNHETPTMTTTKPTFLDDGTGDSTTTATATITAGDDDEEGEKSNPAAVTRVPLALQEIILHSNRGNEVNEPPPPSIHVVPTTITTPSLQPRPAEQSPLQAKKVVLRTAPKYIPSAKPTIGGEAVNPQLYLNEMLGERGYSTTRYPTLETGYYNQPTPLQLASYDTFLIKLIRNKETQHFQSLLSCGMSPNPCNKFGESIVHLVSRRGDTELLRVLLEHGCSLQVSDDYGRTPLHDACWAAGAPCFDLVDLILRVDRRMLFLSDCRGAVPLAYVRKEYWSDWVSFLEARKDVYWSSRGGAAPETPPPLSFVKPGSNPLPDPYNALPLEMVRSLAAGRLTPRQVEFQRLESYLEDEYDEEEETDSDYDSEEEDDDEYSEYESYVGTEFGEDDLSETSEVSFDPTEFPEILKTLRASGASKQERGSLSASCSRIPEVSEVEDEEEDHNIKV